MTRIGRNPSTGVFVHGAVAIGCGSLLCAVGQPIFTDDLWWHLALGREFAEHGPWLAEDPLLFAPAGPPSPASWLSDVALAGVARAAGFSGLRALHVALVAAILALAWSLLRRTSRSAAVASLGTLAFAALAAYRLVQLRPELVTIGACLLFYRWLLADAQPPSWRRIAIAAAVAALWANSHAGFPLALLLIGAALGGITLAAPLRTPEQHRNDRARAVRLAAALGVASLSTLANPDGVGAHLAYFAAGTETPSLELIVDEWTRVHLFALPAPPQLPSPLNWALVWAILLGVGLALWRAFRASRAERGGRDLDPALVGVSLLALGMLLSAVRFLWLGIFPLLLLSCTLSAPSLARGEPGSAARRRGVGLAAAAALLAVSFFKLGDWPAITRATSWARYASPYPVSKYYADAIWLLADSGVQGNLYGPTFLGGFAGYWLAPDVRSISNGTLNVSAATFRAMPDIAMRRGQQPGESFAALLDRLRIDLFLGIRLPEASAPGRVKPLTTAHLEDTPGWIPIFRNVESALYLRANERNRDNLDRIARYYGELRVPFDPTRGFEIDAVIAGATDWAIRHGVVPRQFQYLILTEGAVTSARDVSALDQLAALYAVLGRYERAIAIDRSLLRANPQAVRARRRLVWSLLRIGRGEEAVAAAAALDARPLADGLSHLIANAAREATALDAARAREPAATLPFLSRAEAFQLSAGIARPGHRPPRQ